LQSIAAHTSVMARMASDHLPIVARFQFGAVVDTAATAREMAAAG
jgi:hypothetical protein